jgi:hypothetical protein
VRLRLKHALEEENMPRFAEDIVTAAAQISGTNLDYTPESLKSVDDIIENMRRDGMTSAQLGETLFGFGCYVGEVMCRNAGATWARTTAEQIELFGFPLVIELPNKKLCNPIGKVFKRLDNGDGDSLPYFYQVFTTEQ